MRRRASIVSSQLSRFGTSKRLAPQSNPFAESSSPRAPKRVGALRALGQVLRVRPVQNILRRFGAWERLGLPPDPQPLADLCDEAGHKATLLGPPRFPRMGEARIVARAAPRWLLHDLGANGRVRRSPDAQVQLDLAALLIGAWRVGSVHLDHAAARPLAYEVRAAEMQAEIVHDRLVVKSNQHGPQNPQPYSSALALHSDKTPNEGKRARAAMG